MPSLSIQVPRLIERISFEQQGEKLSEGPENRSPIGRVPDHRLYSSVLANSRRQRPFSVLHGRAARKDSCFTDGKGSVDDHDLCTNEKTGKLGRTRDQCTRIATASLCSGFLLGTSRRISSIVYSDYSSVNSGQNASGARCQPSCGSPDSDHDGASDRRPSRNAPGSICAGSTGTRPDGAIRPSRTGTRDSTDGAERTGTRPNGTNGAGRADSSTGRPDAGTTGADRPSRASTSRRGEEEMLPLTLLPPLRLLYLQVNGDVSPGLGTTT